MNNGLKCFIVVYILMQPSQYINTLLVPRNSKISVDVDLDKRACYFKQTKYGKLMRMALILKLLGVE
jgi:aspartate carbamoyltransferase catalytic subunit